MANIEKKIRGRKKVPLLRMEKESNRLVTFSKCRYGLFKKASELCTLCGSEAAIVVFSPRNKAYSFGHPSIEFITDRFLSVDFFPNSNMFHGQTSYPHQKESVLMYNMQLTLLHDHLELEKKHLEKLNRNRKIKKEDYKWLIEFEELFGENLQIFKELLNTFKDAVSHMYHEFFIEVHNANRSLLTGENASRSAYQYAPLDKLGGENLVSTLYSGQPHQMEAMIPSELGGGPINFYHYQMMMMMKQNLIGERFGGPSLIRGSRDVAIDHILNGNVNVNANAKVDANANVNFNPISSLQNPMGIDFPNPNLLPSFQGQNNPMGSQFDGLPPLPSLNMDINSMQPGPPMNMGMNSILVYIHNFTSSSSSLQAGTNSMDTVSAPYQLQNEFGFGNGLY